MLLFEDEDWTPALGAASTCYTLHKGACDRRWHKDRGYDNGNGTGWWGLPWVVEGLAVLYRDEKTLERIERMEAKREDSA